jgi:hypothetical protein
MPSRFAGHRQVSRPDTPPPCKSSARRGLWDFAHPTRDTNREVFLWSSSLFVNFETRTRETSRAVGGTTCKGQECTMVQHYTVTYTGDRKWVVSVDGDEMMICKHKSDAVKAAKDANQLLDQLTIRKAHSCFV